MKCVLIIFLLRWVWRLLQKAAPDSLRPQCRGRSVMWSVSSRQAPMVLPKYKSRPETFKTKRSTQYQGITCLVGYQAHHPYRWNRSDSIGVALLGLDRVPVSNGTANIRNQLQQRENRRESPELCYLFTIVFPNWFEASWLPHRLTLHGGKNPTWWTNKNAQVWNRLLLFPVHHYHQLLPQ